MSQDEFAVAVPAKPSQKIDQTGTMKCVSYDPKKEGSAAAAALVPAAQSEEGPDIPMMDFDIPGADVDMESEESPNTKLKKRVLQIKDGSLATQQPTTQQDAEPTKPAARRLDKSQHKMVEEKFGEQNLQVLTLALGAGSIILHFFTSKFQFFFDQNVDFVLGSRSVEGPDDPRVG